MAPFTHLCHDERKNVGIHAMEIYFPKTYVSQAELEKDQGVKEGKFTVGLGQTNMAVAHDSEDIVSIMLSVTQSLMEKYVIDPRDIGRLEVGTETLIDKSKSIKSTLVKLLNEEGNHDVEGVDSINACYGGTAALLNSFAWVESSAYDGRYALVVCGDIAVYEAGPARPTGGVAVMALLIGPDAPIAHNGVRASHMEDAYDFYKPNLVSQYPVVFGHESNECYLRALDGCYQRYADKYEGLKSKPFSLDSVHHVICHSPYNKLVQKSGARMVFNDFRRNPGMPVFQNPDVAPALAEVQSLPIEKSYSHKVLDKTFGALSKPTYAGKMESGTRLPRQLGNSYTASLYTGLLSLVDSCAGDLKGKQLLMFSYGSGLAATLFGLTVRGDVSFIAATVNLQDRLAERVEISPAQFHETLALREHHYTMKGYENPEPAKGELWPGTYFLAANDEYGRRSYKRSQVEIAKPVEMPLTSRL